MKLLSYLFSSTLKPSWSFSAEHVLWRVMFSDNGLIIGEDRNTEKKSATFFCYDTRHYTILWKEKNFGEQWWIGLSAVTKDRLYLHGFRKPDMPEQKNIIAVELQTGNLIWKNSECTFLALQSPYIYGYKDLFERRLYYRIDERDGTVLEELNSLPSDIPMQQQYEKTDFTFPEPDSSDDPMIQMSKEGETGFVSAEHITKEQFIVRSVYSRHSTPVQGMKNTLSIIDTTTKKKVYSDVLNESTQYPVPDSFFMDGTRVYYIKERKTFVALDLP